MKAERPNFWKRWQRNWLMLSKQSEIDRVFHALGDPTRRAIISRVSRGPVSVSDLAEPLKVSLAAVVQHLQVLEDSGLVKTEKVGRVRSCRVDDRGFALVERWINDHRAMWERRLDRLGAFLDEDKE